MRHLFDQTKRSEPSQLTRQRPGRQRHVRGQISTSPAVNIELPMLQCLQESLFSRVEKVQSLDALFCGGLYTGLTQALQITLACAGVIQAAQKRQTD